MKPKVLIIGAGSSGKRFAKIFLDKKFSVYFYKHRENLEISNQFKYVEKLTDLKNFKLVVVSSPTNTHYQYLTKAVTQGIPVLVDKPLVSDLAEAKKCLAMANKSQTLIYVGFNLRLLAVIKTIQQYLTTKKLGKIYHADLYVDQYLPDWRPNKPYQDTYSAHYRQGGGVVLDLIHELDLALAWFPNLKLKCLQSEKLSNLAIDTEDFACFVSNSRPYVTVRLGYLNRCKTRMYRIVGSKGTINCDIVNQKLEICTDTDRVVMTASKQFDIVNSYQAEVDEFLDIIDHRQQYQMNERTLGIDALRIAINARKYIK